MNLCQILSTLLLYSFLDNEELVIVRCTPDQFQTYAENVFPHFTCEKEYIPFSLKANATVVVTNATDYQDNGPLCKE